MCNRVTMETSMENKYTCHHACDVRTTGTTELKITSQRSTLNDQAICDIKVT